MNRKFHYVLAGIPVFVRFEISIVKYFVPPKYSNTEYVAKKLHFRAVYSALQTKLLKTVCVSHTRQLTSTAP